jgi:hypothetical protein
MDEVEGPISGPSRNPGRHSRFHPGMGRPRMRRQADLGDGLMRMDRRGEEAGFRRAGRFEAAPRAARFASPTRRAGGGCILPRLRLASGLGTAGMAGRHGLEAWPVRSGDDPISQQGAELAAACGLHGHEQGQEQEAHGPEPAGSAQESHGSIINIPRGAATPQSAPDIHPLFPATL